MGFWDRLAEVGNGDAALEREKAKLQREQERARQRREANEAKTSAIELQAAKLEVKARRQALRDDLDVDDAALVISAFPVEGKGKNYIIVRDATVEMVKSGDLSLTGWKGSGNDVLPREAITGVTMTKTALMTWVVRIQGRGGELAFSLLSEDRKIPDHLLGQLKELLLSA